MSLTRSATVDYDGVGYSRPDNSCPGHATGPLGSNIITQRSMVQIHAPLPMEGRESQDYRPLSYSHAAAGCLAVIAVTYLSSLSSSP